MNSLPREIFSYLLSYLDIISFARSTRTCKLWKVCAKEMEGKMYGELNVGFDPDLVLMDSVRNYFFQNAENTLHVPSASRFNALMQSSPYGHHLRTLRIGTKLDHHRNLDSIRIPESVKSVELELGHNFTTEDDTLLAVFGSRLKKLQIFNVDYEYKLSDAETVLLRAGVPVDTELFVDLGSPTHYGHDVDRKKGLVLYENITAAHVFTVCQLKEFETKNLVHLSISYPPTEVGCCLSDTKNCTKVRYLRITSSFEYTRSWSESWTASWPLLDRCFPRLETLNLRLVTGPELLCRILEDVCKIKTLRCLHLSLNHHHHDDPSSWVVYQCYAIPVLHLHFETAFWAGQLLEWIMKYFRDHEHTDLHLSGTDLVFNDPAMLDVIARLKMRSIRIYAITTIVLGNNSDFSASLVTGLEEVSELCTPVELRLESYRRVFYGREPHDRDAKRIRLN